MGYNEDSSTLLILVFCGSHCAVIQHRRTSSHRTFFCVYPKVKVASGVGLEPAR
jgi:hypothetical protein